MSIVAVAITLSFHLKSEATAVELRMARPLGLIFWFLAVACLTLGFGNYIREYLFQTESMPAEIPCSAAIPLSQTQNLAVADSIAPAIGGRMKYQCQTRGK
jgi:hypothetical protein